MIVINEDNGLLPIKWQVVMHQTVRYNQYDGIYPQTSNIRRALVGNKIVDHRDIVGA